MTPPSVSVCFPAYNERDTVKGVLEEAHELLSASNVDYEILVCDDGSTDGTREIIEKLAGALPKLRMFSHTTNQGIFATFEQLYAEATKQFVFLNSTDRQWDTAVLFELLPLAADADIVIASRRDKHYGLIRGLVSWAFNAIPSGLFGVRTYDAGAVKLMRREIISRYAVVSTTPFAEAERLIKAARDGYRIVEHRVDTAPRRTGRTRGVNVRIVVRAAMDVARVWVVLRRQRQSHPAGMINRAD